MMRKNEHGFGHKLIRTFFAAALSLTMVPATALAEVGDAQDVTQPSEAAGIGTIAANENNGGADASISAESADESLDDPVGREPAPADGEAEIENNATTGEDSNLSIPAATQRINQDMTLQTRTVAQAESTRTYFLAQTLESTRTVPIVSANLPLDTGNNADVVEGDNAPSQEEGGEESDDPDLGDLPIAASSTVVGSFTNGGLTYAVEPGGETVAVVAADYNQLPETFIENQVIVIPDTATVDGLDYYTVSRIADYAFADYGFTAGIAAVAIPGSVLAIGDDAFARANAIQHVIASEDNPVYSQYDGALYDADQTCLLLIPEGRTGAVCIAPSAETVTPEVFSHCPSVDAVYVDADSAAFTSENGFLYKSESDAFEFPVEVIVFGGDTGIEAPSLYVANESIWTDAQFADSPLSMESRESFGNVLASEYGTYSRGAGIYAQGPSLVGVEDYTQVLWERKNDTQTSTSSSTPTGSITASAVKINYRQPSILALYPDVAKKYPAIAAYDHWRLIWDDVDAYNFRIAYDPTYGVTFYRNTPDSGFNPSAFPNKWHYYLIDPDGTAARFEKASWAIISHSEAGQGGPAWFIGPSAEDSGNISWARKTGYTQFYHWVRLGYGNAAGFHVNYDRGEYWQDSPSVSTDKFRYPNNTFGSNDPITFLCESFGAQKNGHIFVGWTTYHDGTRYDGTFYPAGVTASITSPTTLYAVFEKKFDVTWDIKTLGMTGVACSPTQAPTATNHIISTDAAGNTVELVKVNDDSTTMGTTTFPTVTGPANSGYIFAGWTRNSDGSPSEAGKYKQPGDPLTVTADQRWYAAWSPSDFTVTYDLDGGSLATANPSTYTIESARFTLNNPTKTGYTFQGWTGTGLSAATASVSVPKGSTGDRSYTATWKANKYNVTFVENGTNVSGMPVGFTAIYDADATLGTPTRTGYKFTGWNTEANGSGTSWAAGTQRNLTSENAATVTLYAQWAPDNNTLKLSANNGRGQMIPGDVPVMWDTAVPAFSSVPALAGLSAASITAAYGPAPAGAYVFEGFFTAPIGGTQYYDADLAPVGTYAHDTDTLYAHWRNVNDIHNHIYCSSGVAGNFSDGYAYGWTCPSWDTYVARVYVADATTPSNTEGHVFGVPAEYQSGLKSISGKVSVDAVKAGEYELLAGGRDTKAGWLPTNKNGSSWETYGGAWWEITAKPGESTGTLRVHCDSGAVIDWHQGGNQSNLSDEWYTCPLATTTEKTAWRNTACFTLIRDVILDHADAKSVMHWFSTTQPGTTPPTNIESMTFVGNTFFPSATNAVAFASSSIKLYDYSDNFTFRNSKLLNIDRAFIDNPSLASLPKGFTFKGSNSLTNLSGLYENAMNLVTMPDGFSVPGSNKDNSYATYIMRTIRMGFDNPLTEMERQGKMVNGNPIMYWNGPSSDEMTKRFIAYLGDAGGVVRPANGSTYLARALYNEASITWDARGGSYDGSLYYTSEFSALNNAATIPTAPVKYRDAARTEEDALVGWFKKVPLTGTFNGTDMSTIEGNGKTWAENRYLYEYEFVAFPEDAGKRLVDVVGSDAMPTETIVYYALYESDADKIKSNITLKMNDGTGADGYGATFKTITGQTYGTALKEDSGKPSFSPYTFDGFWSDPVGGKQYFDAAGKAVAGLTWDRVETNVTLYAHWRYSIKFDANPAGCAELLHQGADMPTHVGTKAADTNYQTDAYGNRYYYADFANNDLHLVRIDAVRDVAVKLPYAMNRAGYADACRWSTVRDDVSTVLPVDLAGYTVAASGSTTRTAPAVTPDSSGDVLLFADWTDLAKTSTVTLVASGYADFAYAGLTQEMVNEGARTKSVTATFDKKMPVKSNIVPEMKGYSFLGFFAEPQKAPVTGTTDPTDYASGFTMFYDENGDPADNLWKTSGDATLYAHWRQIPYTLSFSLTGANTSGNASPVTVFYGYDMGSAPVHLVAKKGFTFQGWNTASDGSGTMWFDANGKGIAGIKYLATGDTTLYPVWHGKTYSITWKFGYNHQNTIEWKHITDSDGKPLVQTMSGLGYGDEIIMPNPYDHSIAYEFFGWYVGEDEAVDHNDDSKLAKNVYFVERDGKTYFEPADDATCPTAITLYAGYADEATPYEITLYAGDHGKFSGGNPRTFTLRWTGDHADDVDLAVQASAITRTDAGWRQAGWVEVTDADTDPWTTVPYADGTVPLGTGDRTFVMTWEIDTDNPYTVMFTKGSAVSDVTRPHDAVYLRPDYPAPKGFTAAAGQTIDVPRLVNGGGAQVTDTTGYTFAGWYRATTDAAGNTVYHERLDKTSYTGQEMAEMADAATTHDLVFAAKWEPKEFEVRYKCDAADGALELSSDAYTPTTVKYEDEVTLASPVIAQTGAKGEIFERWEGKGSDTSKSPLYPGAKITVLDLVKRVGSASVEEVADGPDIVWLHAEWLPRYAFTVPLTVNIAIDPDRPADTIVGAGYIETTSEREVFVESVSLTRDAALSTDTLQVGGVDFSDKVYLTVLGDRTADATTSATALKMNLGADVANVHRDLAKHGLGTLQAAPGGTDRVNVTYDLELAKGSGLTFRDFENLMSMRDKHKADGLLASKTVGRVFYTLSLVPPTPSGV